MKPFVTSPAKFLSLMLLAMLPASMVHAQAPAASPAPVFFPPSNNSNKVEKNLLLNATFENGTENWELIAFAKKGTMAIDTSELHNGKPTLRIDNVEGDHSFVRQMVKPMPNTRYRMTGYIKTKNVEPVKPGRDGAVLMLGMALDMTPSIQKTSAWKKVSFDFTPSPKTPGEIRVGPSLGTYARPVTGTAWFSELTLTAIGPAGKK